MREHSAVSTQHSVGEGPGVQLHACHHEEELAGEGSAIRRFTAILVTTLREIFEENAYSRFLARHRLANTRDSYALYLRESNLTRERRPRCC